MKLPDFPEEAKIAAKEKRLIVFLGAGLSSAAGLKGWDDLKKDLLQQSKKEEAVKTQWAKMDFYDCFYSLKLENEKNYKEALSSALNITSAVRVSEYSRWIKIINSWSPVSIVTTNVDTLLPLHAGFENQKFRSKLDCSPQELGKDKVFFIHGNDHESIFDSWDRMTLYGNPCFISFLNNLFGSYFILFIGFSFRDKKLVEFGALNDFLRRQNGNNDNYHIALLIESEENTTEELKKYGVKPCFYPKGSNDEFENFIPTLERWDMTKPSVFQDNIEEAGSKPSL